MGQLSEEVKIWNTPIIGAYLLWKFTEGYTKAQKHGDAPIGILHFFASAILTNEKLLTGISDSRPSLQSYIRGFEDNKDSDILLGIQERVRNRMAFTLDAIEIGIAEGLLVWDEESGKIYSKSLAKTPSRGNNLKQVHIRNGRKAEILGKWFAAHDLHTISSYLKVVL